MKLNTKRTVLVGFAFLSICAFWQMYDNLIPKILTETFHMGESVSGIIMAADNVLALFLLPLFGGLSDKCTSRLGRRRPYILFGTLAAVAVMMALPILTDSFHASPDAWKQVCFIIGLGILLTAMGTYRSPAVALMPDVTPKPLRSKANAIINLMGALGGIIYLITFPTCPCSPLWGASCWPPSPSFCCAWTNPSWWRSSGAMRTPTPRTT